MQKTSPLKIGRKNIGGEDLFFIVEEGQANLGDFNKALLMIDTAAETGTDAVEFQLARARDFYVKNDPGYAIYLNREFSDVQIRDLINYAKSKGLEFIAIPLSHRLVSLLAEAGCSAFNINASDLTNPDMIDAVVESRIPFFLSLPLATEEEIKWAVERINQKNGLNYALLHGQHTMASGENGVLIEHTSLGYISSLKERYRVPVGFIDHTPLGWFPAAAVAAGAEIVSKHMVLSRADKGPDWQVGLEPDEMKEAILWARNIKQSINIRSKDMAPGENMDRAIMRRSIVAARKISKGAVIKREDIVFKRPGTGLNPLRYEDVIGRVSLLDIEQDEQILLSNIKEK